MTIEKRSAKTERLERLAAQVTLSTPRRVTPPSTVAGEVFRPVQNRSARRQKRAK